MEDLQAAEFKKCFEKHLATFEDLGEVRWCGGMFKGRVKNGVPFGHGMLTTDTFTIMGVINTDCFTNTCKIIYTDGSNYKGEVKSNKPNGRGILYKSGHFFYEGEFEDGLKHGSGRLVDSEGQYVGTFERGAKDGRGVIKLANIEKKGVWRRGKVDGCLQWTIHGDRRVTVQQNYRNGVPEPIVKIMIGQQVYNGQWLNMQFHGNGTYQYSNNDFYQGQWEKGRRHGRGVYTFSTGDTYDGMFKKDEFEGEGTAILPGNAKFTGRFQSNVPIQGTFINSEAEITGDLLGGQFIMGKINWSNNDRYDGRMLDGELHERGIYCTSHGETVEAHFDRGVAKKAWVIQRGEYSSDIFKK